MSETLKEYLVKIGWDVDELGFEKANDKINEFKNKVTQSGRGLASNLASASFAIFDFITGITSSMFKIVGATADADLRVETFARRMWTTEKNARSLTTALDVLNMSYEDLFFTTQEQYDRFLSLNTFGKTLEAPEELDKTLVKIRDIQFEISKTKMLFQYATRWVVYYIGEFLGKDMEELKEDLSDINSYIQENIPRITKTIASFFTKVYRLGKAAFTLFKNIGFAVVNTFGNIETSGLKTIATISTALLALKSGPVGIFLLLLGSILLLMEDFMVWQKGGKSLFDWSGVQEKLDKFESKGERIKETLGSISDKLEKIFGHIDANKLLMSTVEAFIDAAGIGLDLIDIALSGIAASLSLITGDMDSFKEHMGDIGEVFSGMFDDVDLSFFEKMLGITKFGKSPGLSSFGFGTDLFAKFSNFIPNIIDFFTGNNDTVAKGYAGGAANNGFIPEKKQGGAKPTNQNITVNNNNYGVNATAKDIADRTASSINNFRIWTPRVT